MSANKLLQAAAGNAGEAVYVEDVFSTYLYTGNGSTQTITNGIDLSGEGGLVWIKDRSSASNQHSLNDTERGATKLLKSNSTDAEGTSDLTAFNSNGFDVRYQQTGYINESGGDLVSWTFRKQAGFFDVVTWTGSGTAGNTVSHNLGSAPGCIIAKRTDTSGDSWAVYHRSLGGTYYAPLNGADPFYLNSNRWNGATASATEFTVGNSSAVNASGGTYVAYLFAHDDQSFGDNSDEAIIKCGSFTEPSSGGKFTEINLGFEPQLVIFKSSTDASSWYMCDNMRGIPTPHYNAQGNYISTVLQANYSSAEGGANAISLTSTGFKFYEDGRIGATPATWIYIAIRRPMKTPEAGTEVFKAVARSGNSTAGTSITCGFPLDWVVTQGRSAAIEPISYTRLQGSSRKLFTYSTSAEGSSGTNVITSFDQDGMTVGTDTDINNSSYTYINWFFKRATGFMDVVAYLGTGANDTKEHNLGVTPEFLFVKRRNSSTEWQCYHSALGATKTIELQDNVAASTASYWNDTAPTSSVFSVNWFGNVNGSGNGYIAYLFATLAGVSKVGSYTGTGSNVDVNCGFSSTARFVLIKRTDSTGDWYVYDHARGIVAGNDPFQEWNNAAAETGSTDYIDPLSTGFTITSSAPADLNASSGTYIFLAIA